MTMMTMMMLNLFLICCACFISSGVSYYKVQSESCTELSSSSAFFDSFLLPCGKYRFDSIETFEQILPFSNVTSSSALIQLN